MRVDPEGQNYIDIIDYSFSFFETFFLNISKESAKFGMHYTRIIGPLSDDLVIKGLGTRTVIPNRLKLSYQGLYNSTLTYSRKVDMESIKKYVFFSREQFNVGVGGWILFAEFYVVVFSLIFYPSLYFLLLMVGDIWATMIVFFILSKRDCTFFRMVIGLGIEMCLLFLLMNGLNYALMKRYEICSNMTYFIWCGSEIVVSFLCLLLNKWMLSKMKENYKTSNATSAAAAGLGAIAVMTLINTFQRGKSDGDIMGMLFYGVFVMIYLLSVIMIGCFYKGFLIKKYNLEACEK